MIDITLSICGTDGEISAGESVGRCSVSDTHMHVRIYTYSYKGKESLKYGANEGERAKSMDKLQLRKRDRWGRYQKETNHDGEKKRGARMKDERMVVRQREVKWIAGVLGAERGKEKGGRPTTARGGGFE